MNQDKRHYGGLGQAGKAWLRSTTIIAGLTIAGTSAALAEQVVPVAASTPPQIQEIYALIEKQQKLIAEQQARIDALEAKFNVATSPLVRPAPSQAVVRQPLQEGFRPPQGQYGGDYDQGPKLYKVGAAAAGTNQPVGDAPEQERPEIAALVEEGGVLTRRGQLILEPSLEYVRTDTNRAEVVGFSVLPGIVIGNIEVREADRNTVISALTARYGITNRLEVETKIPYVYRDDKTTTRDLGIGASSDTTTGADGSDIGDIEVAAHYQINDGANNWPFLIGNLRVKSDTGTDTFEVARDPVSNAELELPTGTGFWSVEPSLTVLYPTDPAVLFANIGYTWNIERNVGGAFGEIDPGDSIGASFGMGMGLNENLSMSLSYDHDFVTKSTRNGDALLGSSTLQIGRFTWGTSLRVSDDVSVNANVSLGATDDAPDLDFLLRVPIKMDLLGGGEG